MRVNRITGSLYKVRLCGGAALTYDQFAELQQSNEDHATHLYVWHHMFVSSQIYTQNYIVLELYV